MSSRGDMGSSLPQGWAWATVGELADLAPNSITDGPFGSNLKTEHYTRTGPRVIRLQNIGDSVFRDEMAHVSDEHYSRLRKHEIFAGDIVIAAFGDPAPRACVVPEIGSAIVKADCIRFKPTAHVVTRFLMYALNSPGVQHATTALIHGVGRPRINLTEIKEIVLPVAPKDEQKRVVEKIEALLTDLDAAVAALKRVKANLKRYRAAVLKAACEGRLVPTEAELARKEGRSYETGEQLLARILKERRAKWEADQLAKMQAAGKPPKGGARKHQYEAPEAPDVTDLPSLPQGWTWATVRQVGQVQLGRQRAPRHHTGEYMRPYLRVANVFEDRIDISDVLEMNFTPAEFRTYQLHDGDILLNEGQSLELIGRPAIYRDELPGACFQNTLVRFRAFQGIEPRYALAVFLSYLHNQRFQKIAKWTTNIAHLGAERFAGLEFPLPPADEQVRIANTVEDSVSVLRNMEATAAKNSKRADRLRQSILKRAFAGKLVPQDPNDEPASVLLARIRAERATNSQSSKRAARPRKTTVAAAEVK